jgi:hypothetical protein
VLAGSKVLSLMLGLYCGLYSTPSSPILLGNIHGSAKVER